MSLPVEQRRTWIRNRREQRKQTKYARLRRQIFRYMLLSVLLAAGVSAFFYLPWCAMQKEAVVVRNNHVASIDQVRSTLTSALDTPLYQLDPKQLAESVEKLSIVQHAFVSRFIFPRPCLVVEVLEEFPWATLSSDPDSETPPQTVIAESGRLISIAEFPKVIQPNLAIYGPENLHLSKQAVNRWATHIAYIEKQTGQTVDYVDMRQPQDVMVKAGDLTLKLGAPDNSLSRRLARLPSVLPAIEPIKKKLDYVDLSLDNNIPLKLAHRLENFKAGSLKSVINTNPAL